MSSSLEFNITPSVVSCERCPRLREFATQIAREKRRAYLHEEYWGRPVPGFGDPKAQLVIVGLAPGAHGANRTGRMITGDSSGLWLYRALYRAGFSNREQSVGPGDGLQLYNAYITCVVKCVPPDNRPNAQEIHCCANYFQQEVRHFLSQHRPEPPAPPRPVVWLTLGQLAYTETWKMLQSQGVSFSQKRPHFKHGAEIQSGQHHVIQTYHPSQQNTFTGKLTEVMLDAVFSRARALLSTS